MFNRIIKISICSLVFLLPLFFLPFSFEAFELNKQYLLFFLTSLAFFSWIAKMVLVDKEIKFKRTPLDVFVLLFLFLAVLSNIFSVDRVSSLFGFYGRFSDGLIGLLSLGALYFLITNNVSPSEKPLVDADKKPINADKKISTNQSKSVLISASSLLGTFIWSVFFIVLISYLSIFGVLTKLNGLIGGKLPLIMTQSTFNLAAGSLEALAVFLSVILVLLIGRILGFRKEGKKIGRLVNCLFMLSILFLLFIIDFTPAWIIIMGSLILFLVISLWKRIFKEDVNRLLIPILIIVVAAVLLFLDTSGFQTSIFNSQLPQEQILSQGVSWSVGLKGAVESVKTGFLGSGLGTFSYDFAKFKPLSFNQNRLWQIRFDRGGSYLAEILGTMGFLGLISYFCLIGFFLMISYFFLQQNRKSIPLLLAFLGLIFGQFFYYQNTILMFTFWLILGLSVVDWQKPVKEKTFSFKDFPELSLVFSTVLIVLGLGCFTTYFLLGKFYLADINYRKAIVTGQVENLERAVILNPCQSQYKILLSRTYLDRVFAETQKPAEERDDAVLSTNAYLAITFGKNGQVGDNLIKGAVELSPNRVAAWETLGMVYRDIQGIAAGSLDWGIKSFEKAITLEPTNPVLHTELGKLYLTSGDTEKAKGEFAKAKELRPDYIDGLIQLALIYEKEDNLEEAVKEIETLARSYPYNADVLFQLGRLYFNQNRVDDAILQFENTISLSPNHANAHYSLGVAYQKKGQITKAIAEFKEVLELNPGNEDVQAKLDELQK